MTEEQLAELVEELHQELRRLVPPGGDQDDNAGALDFRSRARLQAIREALQRVQVGSYGVCEACRSPIPYERLAAIPEAKACVECVGRSRGRVTAHS